MLFFLVCAEDEPCVRVPALTWEVAQLQLLGREITIIIITSSSPSSSSSSSTCVSQRWPAWSRNYNYLDTTTTNTDPLLRSRSHDPTSEIIYHNYCYYVICYYYKLSSKGHHHNHHFWIPDPSVVIAIGSLHNNFCLLPQLQKSILTKP